MFASIIVDISHEKLDRTFQYIIPDDMVTRIRPGVLVNIPFGMGNRLIKGYVVEVSDIPLFPVSKMKQINSVIDRSLPIESRMIALAAWIRENYGGTMNQALKTVVPIKSSVKNTTHQDIRLIVTQEDSNRYLEEFKRKKNMSARARLLEELIKTPKISKELATDKLNISSQTIKGMEKIGIIRLETSVVYRNPFQFAERTNYHIKLNDEQRKVADDIIDSMDNRTESNMIHLIHGITGSGKTEVYMEVIAHALENNKQAIVLIPEIALTYQTVSRFYGRFGDNIAIINSKLSKGEKFDQFTRAKEGQVNIMIGPRSALFAPFNNLGLIIIDEEHEGAYKSEGVPKYHARETAIELAKMTGATVILGSATPSVESYYKACNHEYILHELTVRAKNESRLASVQIIDLRDELKNGNKSIFSRKLRELIEDRLAKHEQTMIFINRRGYAGFVSCRSCGEAIMCPHCSVALKAHNNGKMVCHYCGYEIPIPNKCPSCGSKYISAFGTGTQKVEALVKREFSQARVLRMDMDTTRNKDGHQKILETFADNEADILVGTQMIVKGHDFPNVTLVGIIAADLSLYASDYKASERTFELLTQAAGRAGRGSKSGDVIIQTYSPEHYSIVTAKNQDYKGFYDQEISYRQLMQYPPVSQLMAILISGENEMECDEKSEMIGRMLKETYPIREKRALIIGPSDAGIAKINDIFRKIIYVKTPRYEELVRCRKLVDNMIDNSQDFKNISVQFDFTPINNY